MFDSSVTRGEPTSFGLNQVIPGWTEGVQLMVVGEKTRFWIPGKLAYGDEPKRPGAPSGQLTFDVELLDIASERQRREPRPAGPQWLRPAAAVLVFGQQVPVRQLHRVGCRAVRSAGGCWWRSRP